MKRGLCAAAALIIVCAVMVVLPAAGGTHSSKPHFTVIGACLSDTGGGILHSDSSGFTPSGAYVTIAKYPNGKPYKALDDQGYADRLGQTSHWSWDCAKGAHGRPDPPGIYSLKIIDESNGQSISVKLRVLAKSCEYLYSKCNRKQP